MKKILTRLFPAILILASLYLIPINLALNLPTTRAYLNSLQPDQFAVTWERAWSLYPLRIELTGVAADGQTPTEQWQVDARHAAASVSLLPLLKGEIRVHDLDLADIDLRLRPRPKPEEEQGDFVSYFPVIRNRDPDALADSVPEEEGGALVLEIDDIHVKGEHAFWVSHVRGSLPGEVRGSFRMDTGAGRLSLAGGALDLAVRSLQIADKAHVTDEVSLKGRIEIPPFTLSETEGLELLRVPELDAQIDLPVQDLDFLPLVMPVLDAMELSGQGRLRGRVVLSGGEVLRGTDLVVEAHKLSMDLGPYDFSGDGFVEMRVDPEDEAQADLIVRFDQVHAALDSAESAAKDQPQVLFSGQGLTAQLHAAETDPTTTSSAKRAEELLSEVDLKLTLTIPSMQVADLAVYNRLLPDKWGLRLLGGAGTVSGRLAIASNALSLDLDLGSDEADLRYRDYRTTTDLQLALRARVDEDAGATLHLDGTSLRIDDVEIAAAKVKGPHAKPWNAELKIADGALTLPVSAQGANDDPIPSVAKVLQNQGFGALLDGADGRLSATLTVSGLDWIAELLNRPLDLSLTGSGELDAEIVLADGWPARGTTLTIPREALSMALMEHRVDGQGKASLRVEKGGEHPRLRLAVALDEGRMRRQDEPEPSIGEVRMDAKILVSDPLAASGGTWDVSLQIHSARVRDMSTHNAYLPAHAPLSLISGEASLVGDFHFTPGSAKGELLLLAKGVRMALAEEELSGNLRLDLLIRDGSPENMRFDITGSSLMLDGFQVAGEVGSALAPDWRARLQFEATEVLWHKPMHLDMTAGITIKDTRPFVAILDNVRGEHGWIDNLLTVEDLGGHINLTLDGKSAVLSDAMLGSERINIGAKGRADPDTREGMVYVRWRDLTGALALQGEESHFDLIDARDKFDAYVPGATALSEAGLEAKVEGLGKPTVPSGAAAEAVGAISSPKVDNAPTEPENPFLNEDL
ncbi:MAG: hypothetical protein U9Q81_18410 [Pseudomonadota bacterium]|nr:hypothetical protein [Pseudomonadota bacterium]